MQLECSDVADRQAIPLAVRRSKLAALVGGGAGGVVSGVDGWTTSEQSVSGGETASDLKEPEKGVERHAGGSDLIAVGSVADASQPDVHSDEIERARRIHIAEDVVRECPSVIAIARHDRVLERGHTARGDRRDAAAAAGQAMLIVGSVCGQCAADDDQRAYVVGYATAEA